MKQPVYELDKHHPAKFCTKIPHANERAARRAMLACLKKQGGKKDGREKVNVYKCARCENWHWGHK